MSGLLVVDDDLELCDLVRDYLTGEGFEVSCAHDGSTGLKLALEDSPDLVILDVMLPKQSGFEVLRQLRQNSSVPVIMLTARGEDIDRIVGLELGADDYLPKPFNPRELSARIRAILRRSFEGLGPDTITSVVVKIGDLELDSGARQVRVDDEKIELTGVEFMLLELLLDKAGQVLSRDELSRGALGRRASSYDRSLDVHVSNLRRKLGPSTEGSERIKTVRGVGYVYVKPPSGDS
ncbi:MAG: response regulator transcription factor [bacterium]|nr:response regulator transcription factor [bacterium]